MAEIDQIKRHFLLTIGFPALKPGQEVVCAHVGCSVCGRTTWAGTKGNDGVTPKNLNCRVCMTRDSQYVADNKVLHIRGLEGTDDLEVWVDTR